MDMAFMDMDFHLPFPLLLLKKPQQLKLRPERSVMPMLKLKLTLRLTPGILPMDTITHSYTLLQLSSLSSRLLRSRHQLSLIPTIPTPMDIMDTPTPMAPMLDMLDILMLESMDTPMPDIPMLLPSLLLLMLRSQL